MNDDQRANQIVDVLLAEFGGLMALDPAAFRRKFRKMAGFTDAEVDDIAEVAAQQRAEQEARLAAANG